jgi:hypothetical protein
MYACVCMYETLFSPPCLSRADRGHQYAARPRSDAFHDQCRRQTTAGNHKKIQNGGSTGQMSNMHACWNVIEILHFCITHCHIQNLTKIFIGREPISVKNLFVLIIPHFIKHSCLAVGSRIDVLQRQQQKLKTLLQKGHRHSKYKQNIQKLNDSMKQTQKEEKEEKKKGRRKKITSDNRSEKKKAKKSQNTPSDKVPAGQTCVSD